MLFRKLKLTSMRVRESWKLLIQRLKIVKMISSVLATRILLERQIYQL